MHELHYITMDLIYSEIASISCTTSFQIARRMDKCNQAQVKL